MTDQQPSYEVTSDDKLWALLAYVLSPLVPIIILLMEDKKNRPYLKMHNGQALVLGIIEMVLVVSTVLACFAPILWIVMIYWGIQAYNGKPVVIPVITDFVKNQGWA
ncbi:MAG: DUF4870 domain-containing protein [Chloroflexota bacterium]